MATCCFFGHSDAPAEIFPTLKTTIIDLIESRAVTSFYVGNHGNFDHITKSVLKSIKAIYPHIKYSVVLAYLPCEKSEFDTTDYSDTVYPDGMEKAPLRFAVDRRNRWMIEKSDYVVTYVTKITGGAVKYKKLATNKHKSIIELSEFCNKKGFR